MVRNNVSEELTFSLDDITRTAWAIIFSELEGNVFDWHNMKFKEPED